MSTDYVAVPRSVLAQSLSGTEAAVWVLLARYRRHNTAEGYAWPKRATLMAELGREGHRGDVVSRATTRLERLGLLGKRFERMRGRTVTVYRLPDRQGEAYVHAEYQLLAWLRQDRLSPEQLLALLRWRDACGSAGNTDDTLSRFAARYAMDTCTVKRHRSALVRLGLLHVDHLPGRPTRTRVPDEWTLLDLLASSPAPSPTTAPGPVDNATGGPGTGGKSASVPGANPRQYRGQIRVTGTSSRRTSSRRTRAQSIKWVPHRSRAKGGLSLERERDRSDRPCRRCAPAGLVTEEPGDVPGESHR